MHLKEYSLVFHADISHKCDHNLLKYSNLIIWANWKKLHHFNMVEWHPAHSFGINPTLSFRLMQL